MQNKQILIVEDNPDFLFILSELISQFGACVETCVSSEQALDKIYGRSFDLIICDNQIEGALSGVELCTRFNELDLKTPVVLFTGDFIEVVPILNHQLVPYVQKPNTDQLKVYINSVFCSD